MAAEVEEPILVGGSSSEAQEGGVVVRGEVGEVLVKGIGERRPGMAGIDDNSGSARARARAGGKRRRRKKRNTMPGRIRALRD